MSYSNTLKKIFDNQGQGPKIDPDKIPFATSLSSDSPTDVASTEWVRDTYGPAPIYAAPNGLSTNDGLSAESPVDIETALLTMTPGRVNGIHSIHLAAGTYDVLIDIYCQNINFVLDGSVTFNKGIKIAFSTFVIYRSDDSYTLTINNNNAHAFVSDNSHFYTPVPITISVSGAYNGMRFRSNSNAVISSVSMTLSGSGGTGLGVVNNSYCEMSGDLTFSGTTAYRLIEIISHSTFYTASNINGSAISPTSAAIIALYNSVFRFEGSNKTLNVTASAYDTLLISGCSTGVIGGTATIINTSNNLGWLSASFSVEHSSYCLVSGKLYLKNTQKTGSLLLVSGGSSFSHTGTVLDFTGVNVVTGTVVVRENSMCQKNTAVSVSGTVTTGRKYNVHDAGVLSFGDGLSGIPGSTNPNVESSSYSVAK